MPTDYQTWLREWFPSYVSDTAGRPIALAKHHHDFWAWVWSLKRGERPPPFVAIWPRGGGKSTSAELACVAVGARDTRRYVLYVSATQQQADDHVQNVASLLESSSVEAKAPGLAERSLGKYGNSRGWRRNRLRTAAGLIVDALGLDTAARGVKLDEQRPDMLILDDIDDTSDSPEATQKKVIAITQKLLPAGSPDAGTLAVQNLVHHEGVFARLAGLASDPADFLSDRIVSGPHPALKGFQVEKQPDGKWLIVAGESTWEGQNRDICQRQVNDWGIKSFRSEAQHEKTPPEGQAFDEFDPSIHVCAPFPIPETWVRWRSIDYGFHAPYCCLWFAQAPSGRIYVYRETYATKLQARAQALEIKVFSAGERIRFTVADPSMWASTREGKQVQSIAGDYGEMGIALIKANNERVPGWNRLHAALEGSLEVPPVLQIFATCTNLIRTLPLMVKDDHDPDDIDTTLEDHAPDAARYGLMAAQWAGAPTGRRTRRLTARG